MTRTHFLDWTRDDEAETDITVEYTISGGCPAHMGSLNYPGHPAEAPEVEIVNVWLFDEDAKQKLTRVHVSLTDAEAEKVRDYILENPPEDDGDPDDARERKAEQQRDDDLCGGGPDEF